MDTGDRITRIKQHFADSIETKQQSRDLLAPAIASAAGLISRTLDQGGKILSCGNGGSAGDAQHFSSEMLNRFEMERPGLPAVALTTDTSTLTSIANDYDYSRIFSKQVLALGNSGDTLLAISTSGNSKNVVAAFETAKEKSIKTLGFTGEGGGNMAKVADHMICVPSKHVQYIQECHIAIGHVFVALIEKQLYS